MSLSQMQVFNKYIMPATIETLVDQYPYKDQILKGSGASGGGAQQPNGGGGGQKQTGNLGGTREERAAAFAAQYPELAKG